MRKSTIFISVVLTTFALVMLYGVVNAYRNSSNVLPDATQVTPVENTLVPEPTLEPTPMPIVTPRQAAQLAAAVVGQTNLFSAESSLFNEVQAYKITFTNNDVVYVGLDGQILSVQVAPVVMNVIQPVQVRQNNNGGNGGDDDHSDDDDDDHEDDEDHDD